MTAGGANYNGERYKSCSRYQLAQNKTNTWHLVQVVRKTQGILGCLIWAQFVQHKSIDFARCIATDPFALFSPTSIRKIIPTAHVALPVNTTGHIQCTYAFSLIHFWSLLYRILGLVHTKVNMVYLHKLRKKLCPHKCTQHQWDLVVCMPGTLVVLWHHRQKQWAWPGSSMFSWFWPKSLTVLPTSKNCALNIPCFLFTRVRIFDFLILIN